MLFQYASRKRSGGNNGISTTLEQFEIGFMRDAHPEREVALWCSITAAWLAYHEKFLGDETLPDDDERKMLGAKRCCVMFRGCKMSWQ
jgi:hypothetical protein